MSLWALPLYAVILHKSYQMLQLLISLKGYTSSPRLGHQIANVMPSKSADVVPRTCCSSSILQPIIYIYICIVWFLKMYMYIIHMYIFGYQAWKSPQQTTKYAPDNRAGKGNLKQTQFIEFLLHLYPLLIWIKVSNSTLLQNSLKTLQWTENANMWRWLFSKELK